MAGAPPNSLPAERLRRIVFVSTSTMMGGGEFFLLELLPCLRERGWEITLILPPNAPLASNVVLAGNARIVPLDMSMHIWSARAFLRSLRVFQRLAASERRALFYGNGFFTMKLLVLARALAGIRRAVVHLHESSYEWYPTPRARLQAPLIRRFIAISEAVRRQFIDGARVKPEKVALVHNGVPVASALPDKTADWRRAERRALGLPEGGLLVGMAARTNALKGHEVLLHAWRRVLNAAPPGAPPPRLVIAGLHPGEPVESALYEHLMRVVADLHLAGTLEIRGEEPLEQVRRLMAAADVWTVPSTSEGFGRTAIEAMAEGTALVASRVGGLAEILADGKDGVLVAPGDSDALADSISSLLREPARRDSLATAGHATARAQFSVGVMADAISALCDDALR